MTARVYISSTLTAMSAVASAAISAADRTVTMPNTVFLEDGESYTINFLNAGEAYIGDTVTGVITVDVLRGTLTLPNAFPAGAATAEVTGQMRSRAEGTEAANASLQQTNNTADITTYSDVAAASGEGITKREVTQTSYTVTLDGFYKSGGALSQTENPILIRYEPLSGGSAWTLRGIITDRAIAGGITNPHSLTLTVGGNGELTYG